MFARYIFITNVMVLFSVVDLSAQEFNGDIINTHAQFDKEIEILEIAKINNSVGISQVLLSGRGKRTDSEVVSGAQKFPNMVVPKIRTKGTNIRKSQRSANSGCFGAIQELLIFHAAKYNKKGKPKAPEASIDPNGNKVNKAISIVRSNDWPLPLHVETKGMSKNKQKTIWRKLNELFQDNRDINFTLPHMGQLNPSEVKNLIDKHPNVYFQMSHTTSSYRTSRYPWTTMFKSGKPRGRLKSQWKTLLELHPQRFLLAFDGVFANIWRNNYRQDVKEWRVALGTLSEATAKKIASENAIRLWSSLRTISRVSNCQLSRLSSTTQSRSRAECIERIKRNGKSVTKKRIRICMSK